MGKPKTHYEVIVVGAGVAGIYQIKRLADLGIDATVLESAPDLGGTWYWNRYPGCRFDSESYTYGFSFSRELLDEWHWKEHFSSQPENLRYLNYVAEKFDLRKHMQFNCKVEAMQFEEARNLWQISVGDGRTLTCRFVILAIGLLSAPTMPKLEGIGDFKGRSFHTYYWPHEPVDLKDTGRFQGQEGGGDRHRRDRHSVDRGNRRQSRRPHRIPAAAKLECAAQQQHDLRRRNGPHSCAL